MCVACRCGQLSSIVALASIAVRSCLRISAKVLHQSFLCGQLQCLLEAHQPFLSRNLYVQVTPQGSPLVTSR